MSCRGNSKQERGKSKSNHIHFVSNLHTVNAFGGGILQLAARISVTQLIVSTSAFGIPS